MIDLSTESFDKAIAKLELVDLNDKDAWDYYVCMLKCNEYEKHLVKGK